MRILKDDFKQKFSIEMICHLVQEERITKNILKYECYSTVCTDISICISVSKI